MARTKQTGRKSTGGRAPRKSLGNYHNSFDDHTGRPVVTTICSIWPDTAPAPKLSLHLYTLSTSEETASQIGEAFLHLKGIIGWGNVRNWWPRVDVYSPLSSVEECMEHHRREKKFRKETNGLHIVPNWSRRGSYGPHNAYRNVIFVIDVECPDWQTVLKKGLLGIQFDLDIRPGEEFEIYEAEDLNEPLDEGLIERVPLGDDPRIDQLVLTEEEEHKLYLETQARYEGGDFRTDPHKNSLYDVWCDMTKALNDCSYRRVCCDGCDEGVEHTDCEIAKDRHFFNDNGECIACSEFKGPWPEDDEEEESQCEPVEECAGARSI